MPDIRLRDRQVRVRLWQSSVGPAKGESLGPGSGEDVILDAKCYTLTPNGLQAGVADAGTKSWKSTSVN
jgi:hypothetical protein